MPPLALQVEAEGATLPEAFEAAAVNLVQQLIDADAVGEALREKIILEAADPSALLKEWLNRLIDMIRIERMVFSQFRVLSIQGEGPLVLRAEVTGELIDPHRHQFQKKIIGLSCQKASIDSADPVYRVKAEAGY